MSLVFLASIQVAHSQNQKKVFRVWASSVLPPKILRNIINPLFDDLSVKLAHPVEVELSRDSEHIIEKCKSQQYHLVFAPKQVAEQLVEFCHYKLIAVSQQELFLFRRIDDHNTTLETLKNVGIIGNQSGARSTTEELEMISSHIETVYFSDYFEFMKNYNSTRLEAFSLSMGMARTSPEVMKNWVPFHSLGKFSILYVMIDDGMDGDTELIIQNLILGDSVLTKSIFQDELGLGPFKKPTLLKVK